MGPDGEKNRCIRLYYELKLLIGCGSRHRIHTMNFLQARLSRHRSRGMLVQRPEMAGKIQLLVNIDLLITED